MQSSEICVPLIPREGVVPGTILFVDDVRRVLEGLHHDLAFEPYRILTAESASEALDILASTRVDVVVSDERMPKMSGSQLLSIVCRDYPRTIRIILTGHASIDATIRAINAGEVYRYLTKPLGADELASTIKAALQLRELAQESARLLHDARSEQAVRNDLELLHPGITRIDRDAAGALLVCVANDDVDRILEELREETRIQDEKERTQ